MEKLYNKIGDELVEFSAEDYALDELHKNEEKVNAIASVDSILEHKIKDSLVSFKGTAFQASEKSQIRIDRVLSRFKTELPTEFKWWDKWDVKHALTREELAQLSDAMVDVGVYEILLARDVKDSCTGKTIEEIVAIIEQYINS